MHAIIFRFTFVDIIIISILIRGIYLGKKNGLLISLFNLVVIIIATFLSVHYYNHLGNFLRNTFLGPKLVNDLFCFCFLAIFNLFIFSFIREGWLSLFKKEIHPVINRWTGIIISVIRSFFICGLTLLGLLILGNKAITKSVKKSSSYYFFKDTSINLYRSTYYNIINNFFPEEKINDDVFKLFYRDEEKKIGL